MRRMEKITGRTDDMIILRSVNLFPAQIEDLILRIPAFVGPFSMPAGPAPERWTNSPCESSDVPMPTCVPPTARRASYAHSSRT
jgi:acyl-CoA synthetase (AMP-forming)/AMP-acid ligase II